LHSHKLLNPLAHSGLKVPLKLELEASIRRVIDEAGGWIDFARFMSLALYDPVSGYYSAQSQQIGDSASTQSDFVTAPELTAAFGRALSVSVGEALEQTQTDEVWEFGPGTGELAAQLLQSLGSKVSKYNLVELSGALQARQRKRLSAYADKVRWVSELPHFMRGVVIGNEILDALPVNVLKRVHGVWYEQGVCWRQDEGGNGAFQWEGRETSLRPPCEEGFTGDYLTEIHPQAEAFVQTLVQRMQGERLTESGNESGAKEKSKGAIIFLDYGFPEAEYYHPQRHMGTLMCHLRHTADDNPLVLVGHKDITAHVDFTGVALAAQEAGANVLGYTSQANFLLNTGFLDALVDADMSERANALKVIHEHEMGELFKVLILGVGVSWDPLGCAIGDRTHTL